MEMVEDKGVQLIFHHFYDHLDKFEKEDTFIALIIGKTWEGKITAINAFFHIIRDVKFKDDYRYILIEEAEKCQKDSQNEGYHLYYLKNKNNNMLSIVSWY